MPCHGAQIELGVGEGCLPLTPPALGLEHALQCFGASVLFLNLISNLVYNSFQFYLVLPGHSRPWYTPISMPGQPAPPRRGPPKMSKWSVSENMDTIWAHFLALLCWSSALTGLLTLRRC